MGIARERRGLDQALHDHRGGISVECEVRDPAERPPVVSFLPVGAARDEQIAQTVDSLRLVRGENLAKRTRDGAVDEHVLALDRDPRRVESRSSRAADSTCGSLLDAEAAAGAGRVIRTGVTAGCTRAPTPARLRRLHAANNARGSRREHSLQRPAESASRCRRPPRPRFAFPLRTSRFPPAPP